MKLSRPSAPADWSRFIIRAALRAGVDLPQTVRVWWEIADLPNAGSRGTGGRRSGGHGACTENLIRRWFRLCPV